MVSLARGHRHSFTTDKSGVHVGTFVLRDEYGVVLHQAPNSRAVQHAVPDLVADRQLTVATRQMGGNKNIKAFYMWSVQWIVLIFVGELILCILVGHGVRYFVLSPVSSCCLFFMSMLMLISM